MSNSPSSRISRRSLGAAGAALGALGLSACSGSAVSGNGGGSGSGGTAAGGGTGGGGAGGGTIKVGLLCPQSGVYQSLGKEITQGLELYLEEKSNKLGGRTVTLVKADEGETPDSAKPQAERLLNSDKVQVVVGIVSSAVAAAVKPLVTQAQVPLMITNAGSDALTKDAKFVFRSSWQNRQCGYASAVGMDTGGDAFLMGADYAAGKEHVNGVKERLKEKNVKVVGEAFPPFAKTNDYQPYFNQIASANPKQVYAFFSGSEAIRFVNQYADFGLNGKYPLFMDGTSFSEDLVKPMGDKAVGLKGGLTWSSELDSPENKKFVDAYKKKYGSLPSPYAEQTYSGMIILDKALEKAGADAEGAKLAAAIEDVGEVTTPRGKMQIGKTSHTAECDFYLLEVKKKADTLVSEVVSKVGKIEAKFA